MEEQSIELDCQPGYPRPGDLFPSVISDTGLEPEDFTNTSKLFGNWTWHLTNAAKSELFESVRYTVIKERVSALYERGLIRYGSW